MKIYGLWLATLVLYTSAYAATITGKVAAVTGIATGQVTLSNRGYVYTATFDSSGNYKFSSVEAGLYTLKTEVTGYNQASTISVDATNASEVTVPDIVLEKYTESAGSYSYTWTQDQSYAGLPKTEVSQNVVQPVSVSIQGKAYQMADVSYAQELFNRYGIVLNNAGAAWNQEYAYRLYAVLDRIPQISGTDYKYNSSLSPTQWTLTSDFIAGDIEITPSTVRVSTAAFTYAAPLVVEINGVRGVYFSKRLHHALVNFVTNNGTNQDAVAKILLERFGLAIDTTNRPLNYSAFTNESPSRFQNWFKHPAEIVEVINNFEELPEGMHKISGFKWLVRRLDGTVNPNYPGAPAIAWTSGYMEFMELAYKTFDAAYIARLILHEKSHYVYQFLLSNTLKKEWASLGGWQSTVNPASPDYDAVGGWQTTKTTEFVSAYAHDKNPNEDFAESVAYFVKNPDVLKARSISKYNFIRDNVMLSTSYVSVIRPDLTFTVLNLYPSYDYPGKIKRVATTVTGAAQEDKILTVEIEIAPFTTNNLAEGLSARVMSPVSASARVATYFDIQLTPVNNSHTIFRATQVLSKHLRSGYWQMPNVRITSSTGLERYESSLLYGFKCYLNNPLEDTIAPLVRPNTTSITVKNSTLNGHPIQIATVKFDVTENTGLTYYYAALAPSSAYSLEQYGPGAVSGDGTRTIDFYIKEYAPSGRYTLNQIALKDYGLNLNYTYFKTSNGNSDGTTVNLDETAPSIVITTPSPDSIAPELDVNRITVSAVPTNLTTPDGETLVTVKYLVKDNISGYGGYSNLHLRDPQGVEHYYAIYHRNSYTEYYEGDPTVWTQYTQELVLPRGSIPGIWGLSQMTLTDKAGQSKSYNFTETIRFDPYSTASVRAVTETPAPATVAVTNINQTVMVGHDVVLSAAGVTGAGHWQLSIDKGISWQNITDGTIYSGVTNSLLEVLKVNSNLNNNQYRFITDSNAVSAVTTLNTSPGYFAFPTVIGSDLQGNLYAGDETALTVQKISTTNQVTLVKSITTLGTSDKTNELIQYITSAGSVTTLTGPTGSHGTVRDFNGNVFVADSTNHVIRKTSKNGTVTVLAGAIGLAGSADGTGLAARFNNPTGLAVDINGNVYVADTENSTIRKITSEGVVTTIAGLPGVDGLMDGTKGYAWFAYPEGLTINTDGNLYVADTGNAMIRKVTLTGTVTTLALTGDVPAKSAPATAPTISTPAPAPAPVSTITSSSGTGSGGGGGAPSLWFFSALGLLIAFYRKNTK